MHTDPEPFGVTFEERATWDAARKRKREEIRALASGVAEAKTELAAVERQRDTLIRGALILGVSVADLADDTGLSVARIYQIRANKR